MTKEEFIECAAVAVRGSANDLRSKGLSVAVHNDYRQNGKLFTFWLFTCEIDGCTRAFKGEGATDVEALDKIRAAHAKATDHHHHAPCCPANHYHGQRVPTGNCTCGAVAMGAMMRRS